MNIPLLLKVKQAILEHPNRFDMNWFIGPNMNWFIGPTHCETTACIGGWSVAIAKYEADLELANIKIYSGDLSCREQAQIELGLTHDQAEKLFHVENWPEEFQELYYNTEGEKGVAQLAVDYIDYFIAEQTKLQSDPVGGK